MAVCDLPSHSLQESSLTPRAQAGEQDLGSNGGKGNWHWSTCKTVPPKNVKIRSDHSQTSKLWQCRAFWEYLKTNSLEGSAQLGVCFCASLRAWCHLCWWHCTSEILHILKKQIPQLKKFLPDLRHFISLKVNYCHRCHELHKTCEVCTDFHWFNKYQHTNLRVIGPVWYKLWN